MVIVGVEQGLSVIVLKSLTLRYFRRDEYTFKDQYPWFIDIVVSTIVMFH